MFFRTIRSPLLDRRNYLSLCSCVLRLGSQYLRSFWMRQILYWSQIYNVIPWLLMTWTDSLFSSGFGSFTWIYTCFPYLWVVYLDYCFSASLSLWVVWFLALVGILSFILFLGSSTCILLILLEWRLALLSWVLILTCPRIIDGLSVYTSSLLYWSITTNPAQRTKAFPETLLWLIYTTSW